jgi:hypothetical protein
LSTSAAALQVLGRRAAARFAKTSEVCPGTLRLERFAAGAHLLQIDREVDVRHAAVRQRRAAGEVGHVLDVGGPMTRAL